MLRGRVPDSDMLLSLAVRVVGCGLTINLLQRRGHLLMYAPLHEMIFKSPYPEVTIPEMPLTQFVLQRAKQLGEKPALIDGSTGRVITYGQLGEMISRVAASLAEKGFKKGDVFGIVSSNIPEYAIIFHAVASLGGINTPINPLYTEEEIGHQLKDAGARFLVSGEQFLEKARESSRMADVEEVFVFGNANGATPFATLLQGSGEVPEVKIDPRQ